MIVINQIKCNRCGDVIVSRHRHDFVNCTCGNCFVDGGMEYLRRVGLDYTELSIQEENPSFETLRANIHWGRNYNAKRELLPKTEWIPIKDLADDHLAALVAQNLGSSGYRELFEKEIKFRQDGKNR